MSIPSETLRLEKMLHDLIFAVTRPVIEARIDSLRISKRTDFLRAGVVFVGYGTVVRRLVRRRNILVRKIRPGLGIPQGAGGVWTGVVVVGLRFGDRGQRTDGVKSQLK